MFTLPSQVPDFICIGAQKGGTTWLFKQFEGHPQVCIPEKECNILMSGSNCIKSYDAFYQGCAKGQLRGDISPFYASQPDAAQEIAVMNKYCKIIFLIREPASRAFSQYRMAMQAGRIPADVSLWEAFQSNLQFMQRRGCYRKVFEEYAAAGVAKENILPLPFEWIGQRPAELMQKVYEFLGIDATEKGEALFQRFASSSKGALAPPEEMRNIREWYAQRNGDLSEFLWWRPEWVRHDMGFNGGISADLR